MSKHPKKLPKEKFALISKITHVSKKIIHVCQLNYTFLVKKNYTFLPTIY